jgi:hydrogenase-1 operon protein HyaF
MNEHALTWHPTFPGRAGPAAQDGELRLLDMPTGLVRPSRPVRAAETLSPNARRVLDEVLAALRRQAETAGEPIRISLRALDQHERATLADVLGEGDVWALIGGNAHWRLVESVLTGVWRVEASASDGTGSEWLEVATIPQAVSQAAERMTQTSLALPGHWPSGAMNAPALLAEVQERSQAWQPGEPSHVINFTLLPLTDVDAEVLTALLGQAPLIIRSEGYGSCRIFAAGLRHVWAVQYLNSMGAVILDTLEIGGVPAAALAAREDFADSALRLAEILDAYSA